MADVTLREFARRKSVSLQAVQDAIKSGRIQKNARGRLDEDQLQAWDDYRDPSKVRGNAKAAAGSDAEGSSSFQKAKLQKEVYTAQMRKLEYEGKAGKVVQRDAVKMAAFKIFRETRDGLLNIPDRVAAEVAAAIRKETEVEIDPKVIERIVHRYWDRETRDVLQKLTGGLEI